MYMTCKHYLGRVLGVERSKLECLGKRVLKFEVFFSRTYERSLKRAISERAQNATVTWLLKRTRLRLSEQHPIQQLLIFRFVHLGTNPNFLNYLF